MTETQQRAQCITLKGSAELVTQYMQYGINSILYQRGIYPPEMFQPSEHFGLFIFTCTDEKITSFLNTILQQIQKWLVRRELHKITLVVTNVNTKEVLEKWDFKIDYEDQNANKVGGSVKADPLEVGTKDVKTIQKEIREVIRQITGTVSFLPLLDCLCSFDILTYTSLNCDIPVQWDLSEPIFIANSQELTLRKLLEIPLPFYKPCFIPLIRNTVKRVDNDDGNGVRRNS